MEKKTTQRIIGILVAIALIVILMPLVFSKNDLSTQTAAIKAPPFPDQQQPEGINPSSDASTTTVITQEMANKINGVESSPLSSEGKLPADQPQLSQSSDLPAGTSSVETLPAASMNPEQPSVTLLSDQSGSPAELQNKSAQTNSLSTSEQPNLTTTENTAPADLAKQPSEQNQTASSPKSMVSGQASVNPETSSNQSSTESAAPLNAKATSENNDLPGPSASANASATDPVITPPINNNLDTNAHRDIAVSEETILSKETHKNKITLHRPTTPHQKIIDAAKQPGWVVQLGSFKEKNNARHLADRLRTSGYKAFTREVKSRHGTVQTRVYIGPESQQISATKLSLKVQREMKIRGFITMYKPFEL